MECEPSRMMTFSCTQIEVNNEVHMFVVKDQGHPQNIEFMQICRGCQGSCTMWGMMCLVQNFVLHVVEEEE
jgi:hypothetical protein